jgi:hypothetical protein
MEARRHLVNNSLSNRTQGTASSALRFSNQNGSDQLSGGLITGFLGLVSLIAETGSHAVKT